MKQSLTEWEVTKLKRDIALNNKISALFLEEHDKGLVPDYNAIEARFLQEDESFPIGKIGEKKYVLQKCICLLKGSRRGIDS